MGFFDSLKGKPQEAATPSQPADTHHPMINDFSAPVRYDPDLVPQLVQEHHALLRLFTETKQSHASGDIMALKRALQKFHLTLNIHLAMENASFYGYLQRNLRTNSREHQTMMAFFDEIQAIGKTASQFMTKYIDADFDHEGTHSSFGHELTAIGTALQSRIAREEESLYHLYVPNY